MPRLTLRMGARLQGFPAGWTFKGPVQEQRRQIANALPPIMACAVGLAIREALTGKPIDYSSELSQARVEATGTYRDTASSALATAKELELPLGDGFWKTMTDRFMDNQEKREGDLETS